MRRLSDDHHDAGPSWWSPVSDGLEVRVLVQPGASRSRVVGVHGDALKLAVAAPPERGRANEAVVAVLAQRCSVRPADVRVVAGFASRRKRVRIVTGDPCLTADRLAGIDRPC
jgi:uncharacterized protein (TIGR00251 family)